MQNIYWLKYRFSLELMKIISLHGCEMKQYSTRIPINSINSKQMGNYDLIVSLIQYRIGLVDTSFYLRDMNKLE